MVHISFLSLGLKITIHLAWKAQIPLLLAKEVTILAEYTDFFNVVLKKLTEILSEQTSINEHAIELKDNKQSIFRPIYNLDPVELEIFKTYIITSLANSFIWLFKSAANAFIFFVYKLNDNLRLCVNY